MELTRTAADILESAARTLAGRDDASMDAIAAAAGVGRATVYRHFATREQLLEALTARAVDETAERFAAARLDDVPVEEALARIARAVLSVGDTYAVIVRERVQPSREEEERLAAPVRRVFVRGQAEGVLDASIEASVLMSYFGGLIRAALDQTTVGRLGHEDAAALALRVFLDGARAIRAH